MEIRNYCNQIKIVHESLISYIENENSTNDEYKKLIQFCDDNNIFRTSEEIQQLLQMISKISKNHNRNSSFFMKIEHILLHFQENIKKSFSNFDIFNFFKKQKRILLFLFERKLINIDKSIFSHIRKNKANLYYFYPEIQTFLGQKEKQKYEINMNFESFDEKRKIGENDSYICELIRNDLVKEFIIYVNRQNLSLSSTTINLSIFETNNLILKKEPSLIEYSAFFGSIQIFQYLLLNNVKLSPSLWLYAIHGRNPEIIHLLENYQVKPDNKSLKESIKCHHNEIANYIQNNIMNYNFDSKDYNDNVVSYCFHYYNFSYFENNFKFKNAFHYACEFGHYKFVEILLNENLITNINSKVLIEKPLSFLRTQKLYKKVTALHLAAKNNHIKIVNLLLSQPKIQIDSETFSNCKKLTSVTIPISIKEIGDQYFYGCSSLKHIIIPSSVTIIGNNAFEGCISLENIEIPSSVIKIGNNAFADCSKLTKLRLPSSIKEIGRGAFDGCSMLQDILIPPSITVIKDSLFRRCSLLKYIEIPKTVTEIGRWAFNGCFSLENVEIPSSVIKIGSFAFSGCLKLQKMMNASI